MSDPLAVGAVKIGTVIVDFAAAVVLMDDDIREGLHMTLSKSTPQQFADAYCVQHLTKFGTAFCAN